MDLNSIEDRKSVFQGNDPGTWARTGEVEYLNGIDKDAILYESNGRITLQNLQNSQLQGNSKGGLASIRVNMPFHQHLGNMSKGIGFAYLLDQDYKVRPCVIDYGDDRGGSTGNKYEWKNSGLDYNPWGALRKAKGTSWFQEHKGSKVTEEGQE